MSLMKHDHAAGLHLDVHQDPLLALDLGLLICRQGPADKISRRPGKNQDLHIQFVCKHLPCAMYGCQCFLQYYILALKNLQMVGWVCR